MCVHLWCLIYLCVHIFIFRYGYLLWPCLLKKCEAWCCSVFGSRQNNKQDSKAETQQHNQISFKCYMWRTTCMPIEWRIYIWMWCSDVLVLPRHRLLLLHIICAHGNSLNSVLYWCEESSQGERRSSTERKEKEEDENKKLNNDDAIIIQLCVDLVRLTTSLLHSTFSVIESDFSSCSNFICGLRISTFPRI